MAHLDQQEILEFAAGESADHDAERIYEHLDGCPACAQRYEAVRAIRSNFEGSWEEFAQEFRFRMDATAWEVDVVIRGVLDGSRRLATAALDRISEAVRNLGGLDVTFQPAYAGVGDPARVGPAGQKSEEASVLCGQGRDEEALEALEEAARLDPTTGASANLAVVSEGRKLGEVVVDAGRRAVSVIAFLQADQPMDVAVLTPGSSPGDERRVRLEPVEGARYCLAEFENVPDGSFSLRIERGQP